MHVIGIASDFHRIAFHVPANATEVAMKLGTNRLLDKWLAVFGAVDEVNIILD